MATAQTHKQLVLQSVYKLLKSRRVML